MPTPTFRALQLKAMYWRDEHGHDIKQAILYALVTQGLDERDGRYAKAYFDSTGRRLRGPARPGPAPKAAPDHVDPSIPGADAFKITTVKKLGEVAGADGTFWWKGEVHNPRQQAQPRSPLDTPVLVRVKESTSERGASIGWGQILDAATGEHLQTIRSTSHVLVASPVGAAPSPGAIAPVQHRFASLNLVRTHLMHDRIPGLTPERRKGLRKLAKDRQLVELTSDGQFALRHNPASDTYEVIPAGTGLPFDGLLPDLYLSPDARRELVVTPQPLEKFPSLDEARDFAGRLTELRLTDDTPIDWSDPQLGLELAGPDMVRLNHTILEERAHHDRAHGHDHSPSDLWWSLFEERTNRPDMPEEGNRWADTLGTGTWVWLTIDDEYRPWEILDRADTEFGAVALTIDNGGIWHVPSNLPIAQREDETVLDASGQTIGVRLNSDYVLDGDIIEFDLSPQGQTMAPSGPGGLPTSGATRVRGRALVTHRHAHGGGERTLLLDATIVDGASHEAAPADIALTAYELPEHVYRLSSRATLADQPIQPQETGILRPVVDQAAPENTQPEADLDTDADLDAEPSLELAEEMRSERDWDEALQALQQEEPAPFDRNEEEQAETSMHEEGPPETDADAEASDAAPQTEPEEDDAEREDWQQETQAEPEQTPQNVLVHPSGLSEGEALRRSLLRLLRSSDAPSTPTEHTIVNDAPLYVRVVNSARHGRVLQFGFDPAARRAAAQFTVAELEGATGEQILNGVLARRPKPGLREHLLKLIDDPAAPKEAALQGEIGSLNLYAAVTGHPQHGKVVRFGFDPEAKVSGLFTRSDLQGATGDKVVQIVERYGEAFVQDRWNANRARHLRDRFKAAAQQRQVAPTAPQAAPSNGVRQPRPDERRGHREAPVVSPTW
ncbi:hypothetical protein AB0A81_20975 [Streptomyces flaveolus]